MKSPEFMHGKNSQTSLLPSGFFARRPSIVAMYSIMTILLFCLPGAIIVTQSLQIWVYVPLWLVQAVALIGFSNAAHECTHGLYVRNKFLNRVFGSIWMLPLLLNFGIHRRYHLKHHSLTSQIGDPEYNFDYARFGSVRNYFHAAGRWLVLPTPLHFFNWREALQVSLGQHSDFITNARERFYVICNTAVLLAWVFAVTLATIRWPWLIKAYLVPLVFFFPLLAWFTALPEHYGVEPSQNVFLNTRSVYTITFLRYALWNFNLHTAHHYAPSVPFYHLPALDSAIQNRIVFRSSSYFAFHTRLLSEILRPHRRK